MTAGPAEAAPDLIALLDQAAQDFAAMLRAAHGARLLPAPDWLEAARGAGTLRRPLAWRNTLVRTRLLRRAHVEFFSIPGEIGVLHVCIFPALDRALPIFGFDVVAGRSKATGCFLDLSPTVTAAEPMIAAWGARAATAAAAMGTARTLPDWASMFSAHALAVRPGSRADVAHGLDFGAASLAALLAETAPLPVDPQQMRVAQQRYIAAQRRNDRTRAMLAGCVGPALADAFIERCLFPAPPRAARLEAPRPVRPPARARLARRAEAAA